MAIDGTYAVAYCGSIGLGVAVLKVENDEVIGHDYVGSVIAGARGHCCGARRRKDRADAGPGDCRVGQWDGGAACRMASYSTKTR